MKTTITILISSLYMTIHAQAQGDLTPGSAPVATMKTLEQLEPRVDVATLAGDVLSEVVITNSGSYYLSGNLEVTKPNGITIDAPGVTLDLGGFKVSWSSGTGEYGIKINFGMDRATVRNGTITGFDYGIFGQGADLLFEKLTASNCRICGISTSSNSRVIDCSSLNNSGSGIQAAWGTSITGCTVSSNQGDFGIRTQRGCMIANCTVSSNQCGDAIFASTGSIVKGCNVQNNIGTGSSSQGIYVNNGSIKDCVVSKNIGAGPDSYGISGSGSLSIDRCVVADNKSNGIRGGGMSIISACSVSGNQGDYGIRGGIGSIIKGCSAYGNVGSGASSYGIYTSTRSSVIGCTARSNSNTNSLSTASQGIGIYTGLGSSIRDCTASRNQGDGICVSRYSLAVGNISDFNGFNGDGAGIHVTQYGNRIEGNTVTSNDRGIDVDGLNNLIIRNSATVNGIEYDLGIDNKVGTIITPPSSAAITGSTGGAGLGSTDPWANFTF